MYDIYECIYILCMLFMSVYIYYALQYSKVIMFVYLCTVYNIGIYICTCFLCIYIYLRMYVYIVINYNVCILYSHRISFFLNRYIYIIHYSYIVYRLDLTLLLLVLLVIIRQFQIGASYLRKRSALRCLSTLCVSLALLQDMTRQKQCRFTHTLHCIYLYCTATTITTTTIIITATTTITTIIH